MRIRQILNVLTLGMMTLGLVMAPTTPTTADDNSVPTSALESTVTLAPVDVINPEVYVEPSNARTGAHYVFLFQVTTPLVYPGQVWIQWHEGYTGTSQIDDLGTADLDVANVAWSTVSSSNVITTADLTVIPSPDVSVPPDGMNTKVTQSWIPDGQVRLTISDTHGVTEIPAGTWMRVDFWGPAAVNPGKDDAGITNPNSAGTYCYGVATDEEQTPVDVCFDITPLGPVITGTKTAPDSAYPGEIITYDIVIQNTGDITGTVDMEDNVPDGAAYAGHQSPLTYTIGPPERVFWNGDLGPGETIMLTWWISVTGNISDTILNQVVIFWTGDIFTVTAGTHITTPQPCEPVYDAYFTFEPLTPTIGEVVTFTGSASGTVPITFAWDFGDGITGTAQMVTNTYTAADTYTVTMAAINECGTGAFSDQVTVSLGPTYTVTISEVAWIGDDGRGAISPYNGRWDFDYLSDAQREEGSSPQGGNTAHWVPGDIIDLQGWAHSDMTGSLPCGAAYDLADLDLPDAEMGALIKGVLAFFDPESGSYPPHSLSVMMSPPIYPAELGLEPALGWIFRFDVYASDQSTEAIDMLVGIRYDLGEGVWSDWANQYVPLQPGSQTVAVDLSDLVPPEVQGVQFQLGTENKTEAEVRDRAPVADNVQAGNKKGEITVTFKAIPDIDQKQTYPYTDTDEYKELPKGEQEKADKYWRDHPHRLNGICQAAAYANCLWYWGKKGKPYEKLIPTAADDAKRAAALKEELAKWIYDKKKGFSVGVTSYLKKKGAWYHRKDNPKGLVHLMYRGKNATWQRLKENLEACNDVLLSITWHKANGTKVDDLRHYVTLAGRKDPDAEGKGKIYVSNPWGEYRGVGKDSYDAMDVEVDPKTGRIKIKDSNLTNNVVGSDAAAYCMVDDITIIRPGPVRQRVRGKKKAGGGLLTFTPQALVSYGYTITNTDSISMYHFMLFVLAPYTDVVSPPGWNWTALPGYLPGHEGEPNWSTGSDPGIHWSTTSAPIQPGETLEGFGFSVDALCPAEDGALLYSVLAYESTSMEHGIVFGPLPPWRIFLPVIFKEFS